jgi:hypothetical protein
MQRQTMLLQGFLIIASLASVIAAPFTLHELSDDHSLCSEATFHKDIPQATRTVEGLKDGSCSDFGFSVADGTQKIHSIPFLGEIAFANFKRSTMDVFMLNAKAYLSAFASRKPKQPVSGPVAASAQPLQQQQQQFLPKVSAVHVPKDFFTSVQADALHNIKILVKQSEIQSAELSLAPLNMYKISGGECMQPHVSQTFKHAVMEFGGMSEGSCSTKGFTLAEDDKATMQIPVIGVVTVSTFRKPLQIAV